MESYGVNFPFSTFNFQFALSRGRNNTVPISAGISRFRHQSTKVAATIPAAFPLNAEKSQTLSVPRIPNSARLIVGTMAIAQKKSAQ